MQDLVLWSALVWRAAGPMLREGGGMGGCRLHLTGCFVGILRGLDETQIS